MNACLRRDGPSLSRSNKLLGLSAYFFFLSVGPRFTILSDLRVCFSPPSPLPPQDPDIFLYGARCLLGWAFLPAQSFPQAQTPGWGRELRNCSKGTLVGGAPIELNCLLFFVFRIYNFQSGLAARKRS